MAMTPWPDEHITILRKMLRDGASSHQIGEVLGRKASSIRKYVNNNKDRLGLILPPKQGRNRVNQSQFDKEWYGSVPFGHWAITKPWGKKCDVTGVTES